MQYYLEKSNKYSWREITSDGEIINSEETVQLFGVTLDYRLDFDLHISNICKKAATQLNSLQRLKSFIGFKEEKNSCSKLYLFKFRVLSSGLVFFF